MRGHIRERSPGHWAIILDIIKDGARKRTPSDKEPSLGERPWLRAEELAAQGRTKDAATLRFIVGRPLPRYLLDLLDQEILDLLDKEPELPISHPCGWLANRRGS
jgi:hypothetical protein